MEKLGKPGVAVVTDSFLADAMSSAQDCAMPAIRIVPLPAKTWYTARNQEPRMKEVAAAAFDAIIDALKRPLTAVEAQGGTAASKAVKRDDETIKYTGATYEDASEALYKDFLERHWTAKAGLQLHPTKTRIVDETQKGGFDFLGYHFERDLKWPRKKSLNKFKDAIRAKTKRTNGHSLQTIIIDVNRTLKGWYEYFKHSHTTTFPPLDGWIRMRLRSILRKRQGHKGQ